MDPVDPVEVDKVNVVDPTKEVEPVDLVDPVDPTEMEHEIGDESEDETAGKGDRQEDGKRDGENEV